MLRTVSFIVGFCISISAQAQTLIFEEKQKLFDAPIQGLFDFPVIAVDYDADGKMDYVARDEEQALVIYSDDGLGFAPIDIKSPEIFSRPFTVLDFNQDGFDDIVLGNFIHLFDPSEGNYEPLFFENTSSFPTIVGLADFDANGYMDLLTVLDSGSKLNNLSIYFYDGNTFDLFEFPYDIDPGSIRLGDLEGDGDIDIAFIDKFNDRSPKIIIGDGQGDFVLREVLGYSFLYGRTLDFKDLDMDGDLDFVIINEDNEMTIYENTDHFISPPFQYTIAENTSSLASKVADLNNDGLAEIIRLNYKYVGQNIQFTLDIYQSNGSLNFEKTQTLTAFQGPSFISLNPNYLNNSIQITDATSDGDLDIVVTFAIGENPSVWLFENQSEIFSASSIEANTDTFLYPNPSGEQITIQSTQETNYSGYSIFNTTGQKVQSGSFQQTIHIADLESGPHFIVLHNEISQTSFPFFKID